jgi:hypothetical protein
MGVNPVREVWCGGRRIVADQARRERDDG